MSNLRRCHVDGRPGRSFKTREPTFATLLYLRDEDLFGTELLHDDLVVVENPARPDDVPVAVRIADVDGAILWNYKAPDCETAALAAFARQCAAKRLSADEALTWLAAIVRTHRAEEDSGG